MIQGIALMQDLKLGQYVKLAPRVTFLMQMIGEYSGRHSKREYVLIYGFRHRCRRYLEL